MLTAFMYLNNSEATEGNSSFISKCFVFYLDHQIDHFCRKRETFKSTESSIAVSHVFRFYNDNNTSK